MGAKPARAAFALGRMLVVPSRAESLPYIVLEAAAAGLPIIATNVGGIAEIFGPDADELVPPGDPAALADAIAQAMQDRGARHSASLRLKSRLRASFSVDAMTDAVDRRPTAKRWRAGSGCTHAWLRNPAGFPLFPKHFLSFFASGMCVGDWGRRPLCTTRCEYVAVRHQNDAGRRRGAAEAGRRHTARAVAGCAEDRRAADRRSAYSPIVLAGTVRLIEFALVDAGRRSRSMSPMWSRSTASSGTIRSPSSRIAVLATLAFQAADIYQVQAFRGYEKQYFRLASAWSVVFLIVIGISFFAKAGDQFSRVWLGTLLRRRPDRADRASAARCSCMVRRWTQQGRLDRRTVIVGADEKGAALIKSLLAQRDSDIRIVGVFDDRGDDRAPTAVSGLPKLGTVDDLVEFARRTRVDLVIFSLPISAEQRILQMLKKLWVLPVDIRLAAHADKLRFRPRAYSYIGNVPVLDVLDKPITDWDVVMKWLFDKVVGTPGADRAVAGHADHRHRHQARQPRPGAVQAEALRLQQRADRGLQVPLDARRSVRRDRRRSWCRRTIRASPASGASSARPRSTSCRSSSTWCSRATCRWSARARMRSTPRPRTAL